MRSCTFFSDCEWALICWSLVSEPKWLWKTYPENKSLDNSALVVNNLLLWHLMPQVISIWRRKCWNLDIHRICPRGINAGGTPRLKNDPFKRSSSTTQKTILNGEDKEVFKRNILPYLSCSWERKQLSCLCLSRIRKNGTPSYQKHGERRLWCVK